MWMIVPHLDAFCYLLGIGICVAVFSGKGSSFTQLVEAKEFLKFHFQLLEMTFSAGDTEHVQIYFVK
jgi:hypothetical protein